jgi:micrococcal nuclease
MNNVALGNHIANCKGKPGGRKLHNRQRVIRDAGRLSQSLPCKSLLILFTALIFLYVGISYAAPIRTVTATITKISDGDTVQATTPEGTKLKVRLYGIDAPETQKGNKPGEPFGNASKDYLASLVSQRSVRVEILDIDRYRRMVAILWLAERNVNQEMIAAGMAEAYVEYLKKPYRAPFIQAEQAAKAQGRGVWSQGNRYERPSQFRKRMGS